MSSGGVCIGRGCTGGRGGLASAADGGALHTGYAYPAGAPGWGTLHMEVSRGAHHPALTADSGEVDDTGAHDGPHPAACTMLHVHTKTLNMPFHGMQSLYCIWSGAQT